MFYKMYILINILLKLVTKVFIIFKNYKPETIHFNNLQFIL